MKKTRIIISSLIMVALVSGSAFAWGQGRCQGRTQEAGYGTNQDCPRNIGGQGNFADLSKDQKDALTKLRQEFIDVTYELRSAKFVKHQEIKMLMETTEPDREKLDKLSQEIIDLQKQVMAKRIDFMLAAKKIAPELGQGRGFGKGFGKGCGQGFNSDGPRGCPGQGRGWCGNN